MVGGSQRMRMRALQSTRAKQIVRMRARAQVGRTHCVHACRSGAQRRARGPEHAHAARCATKSALPAYSVQSYILKLFLPTTQLRQRSQAFPRAQIAQFRAAWLQLKARMARQRRRPDQGGPRAAAGPPAPSAPPLAAQLALLQQLGTDAARLVVLRALHDQLQQHSGAALGTLASGVAAPLLDALARGTAAGAGETAVVCAVSAAACLQTLASGGPASCAALLRDARVMPALAAAIGSSHADGEAVAWAMAAASGLLSACPDAARHEQQDSLARLGALEAAVRRLSAGGFCGGAAALLVGTLALARPDDLASAAVAAGALPGLVALLGDAGEPSVVSAATALGEVVGLPGSPIAAAAVDAGAVPALAALLRRAGRSDAWLAPTLNVIALLSSSPTGAERLAADGALPVVAALLRSPAPGAADSAVFVLAAAVGAGSFEAVADALLADAGTAPVLLALLLGNTPAEGGSDTPGNAARVLGAMASRASSLGSPEAEGQALGLLAAIRRAGAVPRLVELSRAALGQELQRATGAMEALFAVCSADEAAANEALDAGAWQVSCRILAEGSSASGPCFDDGLLGTVVSVLAALKSDRCRAPMPATAAEPGLVAALVQCLGRVAARQASGNPLSSDSVVAGNAAVVVFDALEGVNGAQCAVEFVHAGGARHLVRAWGV
jgi:hypothetical protein